MADAPIFRQYRFCQDAGGQAFELSRSPLEVECLAFDFALQRFVSFHVLTSEIRNRAAFRENALEVQSLASPYLAPVVHAGEDEDTPFYVTRLIDGPTLEGYLGSLGSVEPSLAALIIKQVAELIAGMEDWRDLLPAMEPRNFRVVEVEDGRLRVLLTCYRLSSEQPVATSEDDFEGAIENAEERLIQTLALGGGSDSQALSGPDLRLHLSAIMAASRPRAIQTLARLRETIAAHHGDPGASAVGSAHRPGRLLIRETPSAAALSQQFSHSHEVALTPGIRSASYAFHLREQGGIGREILAQTFPSQALLPEGIAKAPPVIDADPDDGGLPVKVQNTWEIEGKPVLGEAAPNGFDLETYLRRHGALQPPEALDVLRRTLAVLEPHAVTRTAVPRLLPRDLVIDLDKPTSPEERERYLLQPLAGLPSYQLRVRTHPSMDALTDGWSYCPRIDAATATGTTAEQTKMRAAWTAELFICLACRLLGLGQTPSEAQVERAGLAPPLENLLLENLPGRFRAGGQPTPARFLADFERAARPSRQDAGIDLGALRPIGQTPPSSPPPPEPAIQQQEIAPSLISPSTSAPSGEGNNQIGLAQALFQGGEPETPPPASAPPGTNPIAAGMGDPAAKILAAQSRSSRNRALLWLLLISIGVVVAYGILRDRGLVPDLFDRPEKERPASLEEIEGFKPAGPSRDPYWPPAEPGTEPEPKPSGESPEPVDGDPAIAPPTADDLRILSGPDPDPAPPKPPPGTSTTDALRPRPAPIEGLGDGE